MNIEPIDAPEHKEVLAYSSIRKIVMQALKKEANEEKIFKNYNGIFSGFKKFDELTSGFQNGEVAIIAVKPGMGKTAFLLSLANNIAVRTKKSIAIFSSERPAEKIVKRMIETETGMSVNKIMEGNIRDGQKNHIHAIIDDIANADIFIDDTPALSIDEFASRAKSLKKNHKIELAIIDHLELMTTSILDTRERNEQLNEILERIKAVAKELNIPVVLFSQVPLTFDNTDTRLSESYLPNYICDNIESIFLLNRTPYNIVNTLDRAAGEAEIILAKHPNVKERQVVNLKFIESIGKFVDCDFE